MNNVSNMGPSNKTSCKWISIPHSLTTNLEFYCFIIILLWVERIEVANWGVFPFPWIQPSWGYLFLFGVDGSPVRNPQFVEQ